MAKIFYKILFLFLLMTIIITEGKKISRSRSSSRSSSSSSSRRTNNQPVPTSLSYSQASAPKPTLFGWQEKTAQKTQKSPPRQSKPSDQKHSYPTSKTGLSGNDPPKKTQVQSENIQRSNAPNHQSVPAPANGPNSHSYPASNSLSGNSGAGVNYPQGSGHSGTNVAPSPHQVQSENIHRSNVPNQQSVQQSASANGHSYPASNGFSGSSGTGYPQGSGLSGANVAPPPYQASNSYKPTNNLGNGYIPSHGAPPAYSGLGNNYNQHGPPPPYSGYGNIGNNYGGYSGGHGGYGPQMPGYFGGYSNNKGFGGVSRPGSTLAGVGIAGAGIGTILTGLALWNLARSTGHHHHTVIYDNRGQPVAVAPVNGTDTSASDSLLEDLVNCTLTISTDNATEVLAIPCSIATSFTPDTDDKNVKIDTPNDNTKCIITVVTKSAREFTTTIPCSVLLNTAAQNNVTEPPPVNLSESVVSSTTSSIDNDSNSPSALKLSSSKEDTDPNSPIYNCTSEPGIVRDPINPCFSVNHNLTVVPLASSDV